VSQRPTLLYILAPSFSGSTLLTYLLAQHRQISTVGELKATKMGNVDQYQCSCGTLIRSCPFWREVKRRADADGIRFSIDDFGTVFHGRGPGANAVVRASVRGRKFELLRTALLNTVPQRLLGTNATAATNFSLGQIICDMQGGEIFVDGSKDSVRLLHLIRSGRWDVRVIYLQRDGRGVANSYQRHRNIEFSAAVHLWRRAVAELENMRARLDDHAVFDLHYESLCSEPQKVFHEIWSWLGIGDQAIAQQDLKQGEFHILGNTMRLGNVSEIRLDEAWKTRLSSVELDLFARECGAQNRSIGYD